MSQHDFGLRTDFYTFAPETLQKEFPDFRIVQEVGKGSMGIVYEAVRLSDDQRVALKVLPPSLTLTDRALARFQKEGEVMAKIEHETIVRVHEHGQQGRLHFFCMEFVEGTTLEERLKIGPMPVRAAAEIGVQVARALQYAHERGVLHRDVKPGNLILRTDGRVAITDFGLARETGTGSLTDSGAIVGTPMYMGPEQILGERHAVDARADVYGLAATLYELVTGQPPFQGPTAQSVLKAVLEKEPTDPRRRRSDLPEPFAAIILRGLEKQPSRRYGSAEDMAEDLQRFLDGERVVARRRSTARRLARAAWRRPLISSLVVVTLVLAISAVGLLQDRHRKELDDRIDQAELKFSQATALAPVTGMRALTPDDRQELLDEARDLLSTVIQESPDNTRAFWVRAKIHHKQQRYPRALMDLDQASLLLGEPTREILYYRIDTLEKINTPEAHGRLSEDLKELLRRDQGSDTKLKVSDHLLGLAEQITNARDRSPVLQQVERLLNSLDEPGVQLSIANARLLELRGDLMGAEQLIRAARNKHPFNRSVHAQAARIFRTAGKLDEARKAEDAHRMLVAGDATMEDNAPTTSSRPSMSMNQVLDFLRQVDRLTRDKPKADDEVQDGKIPSERKQ